MYTELLNNRLHGEFEMSSLSLFFVSRVESFGSCLSHWPHFDFSSFIADVHTFNALIEATALIMSEKYEERWNNILVRRNPHLSSW